MGRVVHGASCPWGELSMERVAHGASCPWGELSMGRVVHGASCPWGELSMGRVAMRRKDYGAKGVAWWSIPRTFSPWACPWGWYIPVGKTSLCHCVPCLKHPMDVMSPNYMSLFHGQCIPDFFLQWSQHPSFFRDCMTMKNTLSVGNRDVWLKG